MRHSTSDEALAGGAAQGSRGVAQSVSLNSASSGCRLHPLLQPCLCGLTPGVLCMGCARWHRHARVVTQRLATWRAR